VYWPMPDEVDVIDLIDIVIAQNRRAYLPIVRQDMTLGFGEVTASTRFCRNQYGIPEPVTTNDSLITARNLHLVITPLSAFDDSGNRIGFGGGYYDRTFGFRRHRTSWLRPRLVGVAFDAQRVAAIKANPWDVTMDAVITENAVYGSGIVI